VKKNNAALALYINARRKKVEAQRKEESRKKVEEEARRKVMMMVPMFNEGKSFKMFRLGGSSPPIMIQGLSLLL
jgi:hypothetical protein